MFDNLLDNIYQIIMLTYELCNDFYQIDSYYANLLLNRYADKQITVDVMIS